MTDTIYQPIATYDGTMADCIALIVQLQRDHPDQIIRMDGDAYAIVGIPRGGSRMTQDKPRQFPNLEDRNRIQKLHGVTGPTAVIAERAKVNPKYAAIELRAMTYRNEARKVKAKNPMYAYVWEVE